MNPAALDTPAKITVNDFNKLLADQHPFAAMLEIEVLEIGFGTSVLLLPERLSHQRLGGIIAGPMLMGLADLALYAAVVGATGNPQAVTASLSINFLRKTPPGGVLARTRILKTGRLASGEVQLLPARGGDPVAHVISTWSVPRNN
ncbi:MAG TPA: PaaI family thioesterase [Candidimonas sp.]|nr:PaaI family thioesterase [Candidimonas sp.]